MEEMPSQMEKVIEAAGVPCAVKSDATTVWAWNRLHGLDVRVLAVRKDTSSEHWIFVAAVGDEAAMQGQVFGGRKRTEAYMRAVRDGMTARIMRTRATHASNRRNRAARLAAAAAEGGLADAH